MSQLQLMISSSTSRNPSPNSALRMTVERGGCLCRISYQLGARSFKKKLEANMLNGSHALSPEKQHPITMAATCDFEGTIMAFASKALFDTVMWAAVPPLAKTVSYSHFAFKMQSRSPILGNMASLLAGRFIEMHQQTKRPNASVVVAELGERLCTNSLGSKVVTSKSSRGATKIFLMRTGVRCKKEHTRLLDVAVVYQHSVAHPGTQHARNKHNEHKASMMLSW